MTASELSEHSANALKSSLGALVKVLMLTCHPRGTSPSSVLPASPEESTGAE